MDLDYMISMLEDQDTSKAYEVLKELEKISDNSNILYPYIDKFVEMTGSSKYVVRVRGFRLFCKQAKWDREDKIDEGLDKVMKVLDDEKPTAVRQALAALKTLLPYKSNLYGVIRERVLAIDYYRYKDTMHGLIAKDIEELLGDAGE